MSHIIYSDNVHLFSSFAQMPPFYIAQFFVFLSASFIPFLSAFVSCRVYNAHLLPLFRPHIPSLQGVQNKFSSFIQSRYH